LHSKFTVGAHAGIVVAGMIGSREWRTLLAVGEAIDSTARLQDCAARESARIVISRQAALGAGMDGPELDWRPVGIDIDGTPMLWSEVSAAEIKSAFAGALTLPSAGP
jgi:class 3 adenylate cyclase